jgi:hypothetical protein
LINLTPLDLFAQAADLICKRVLDGAAAATKQFRIFRLYAATRDPRLTCADINPYTFKRDGSFALPSLEQLCDYQLVVTTNTSAGNLVSMGVPRGTLSLFSKLYFITFFLQVFSLTSLSMRLVNLCAPKRLFRSRWPLQRQAL